MTRNEIQQKAVEKWLQSNKIGTFELATGTGKTIAALHCLYSMPQKDGKVHLFLAETIEREKDLLSDIEKFNELFGVDVFNDYILKFRTYQGVYKLENYDFGLVIGDELHFCLSPEYSKFFFNNKYDAVVGLSATIDTKTSYDVDNKLFTKGDLLNKIAPICFTYTLAEAKEDGIGRELDIYVIYQELDAVTKNVPAGNKYKKFFQTEYETYNYWDKEHKKSWFILDEQKKELKIRITSHKRSTLIFNLPSKVITVLKLLQQIKGKTIVFGNSLDSLLQVTKDTVSSRYSVDKNKEIRENFDTNKIQTIGSFKKLLQGANLTNLDNCILMSYYSSEKDIIQRLGRMRKNGDKVGNAFILLTKNTQEEVWFYKMIENLHDFNIIYCENVDDCIIKYNKNEKHKRKT
jgi:superfamily II DNA or RNA helicase